MKVHDTHDTPPYPGPPVEERWMHGAPTEGGHRGEGPRNYTRSDDCIFEDVGEELTENDAVDARNVIVIVAHGEVTLDGTVPSERMIEIAEEAVSTICGVTVVRNRLRTR